MTIRKTLCIILAIASATLSARAGEGDDFGTWTAINLKGKISDKLKAQLWFEMRTKDNVGSIDCFDVLPSITWSALPFMDLGLGAEFVDARVRKDIGYRPFVTLHLESGPLALSLREMPFIEVYNDDSPTAFTLRSSLKAAWTIPSTRITPYINVEVFTGKHWKKTRHYAGADFAFGRRSSLDVFYMYYTFAEKTQQRHLLGITYNLTVF